MKKITSKLAITGVAIALLAETASAQRDPVAPDQKEPGQQKRVTTGQPAHQAMGHVRLSKLMGANAKSAQGEDLGQIKDALINPQTGEINFALLSTDAAGQKLKPIPWQALNIRSEKECVVSIDRQKLQSGPTVDENRLVDLGQPDYVIRVYTFYGFEPPSAMGGTGAGPGGTDKGAGQNGPNRKNGQGTQPLLPQDK